MRLPAWRYSRTAWTPPVLWNSLARAGWTRCPTAVPSNLTHSLILLTLAAPPPHGHAAELGPSSKPWPNQEQRRGRRCGVRHGQGGERPSVTLSAWGHAVAPLLDGRTTMPGTPRGREGADSPRDPKGCAAIGYEREGGGPPGSTSGAPRSAVVWMLPSHHGDARGRRRGGTDPAEPEPQRRRRRGGGSSPERQLRGEAAARSGPAGGSSTFPAPPARSAAFPACPVPTRPPGPGARGRGGQCRAGAASAAPGSLNLGLSPRPDAPRHPRACLGEVPACPPGNRSRPAGSGAAPPRCPRVAGRSLPSAGRRGRQHVAGPVRGGRELRGEGGIAASPGSRRPHPRTLSARPRCEAGAVVLLAGVAGAFSLIPQ